MELKIPLERAVLKSTQEEMRRKIIALCILSDWALRRGPVEYEYYR
jgi:hypothetical protein